MEQKFKRGNLVRVLQGHIIWSTDGQGNTTIKDISPEDVDKEAIIEYSYAEKYGGNDVNSYSIIWRDTGSTLAWKQTNELELIDEGGEHLIEETKLIRDRISKQNTDLKHISDNWVKNEDKVSSETILFLFEKIGYRTSFLQNGEYFVLFADWRDAYYLFDAIFTGLYEQDVTAMLTDQCRPEIREKSIALFNEVKSIKNAIN